MFSVKHLQDTEAVVLTGTLDLSLYSNSFECMSLVITISWQLSQIVLNNTIMKLSKHFLALSQRDRERKGDIYWLLNQADLNSNPNTTPY